MRAVIDHEIEWAMLSSQCRELARVRLIALDVDHTVST
jgi:hypothetical protein